MAERSRPPRLVVIDLETRSDVHLPTAGLARYSRAAALDVCAYAVMERQADNPVRWRRIASGCQTGKAAIDAWLEAMEYWDAAEEDCMCAHNTGFERAVIGELGYLVPTADFWVDTMMLARYLNLPASLDKLAGYVLGEGKKDTDVALLRARIAEQASGQQLLDEGDDISRLAEYCKRDVDLTARLAEALLPLVGGLNGQRIRDEMASHMRVVDTGMPVDVPLIEGVAKQNELQLRKWNADIRQFTSFPHDATAKAELRKWLAGKGYRTASASEYDLRAAVSLDDVPDECITAVGISIAASATSTRKWEALRQQQVNGRLYDHLVYCAQTTGRWSGFGPQVQNFPNPALLDDAAQADGRALSAVESLPKDWSPMRMATAVKAGLRRAIRAPAGRALVKCDYSQIELRGLLYLCNLDNDLADLHKGADLYRQVAGDIYGKNAKDIDTRERYVGKCVVLAAGYGVGARLLAKRFAMEGIDDAESIAARARDAYHKRWPEVKAFWDACGAAFANGAGTGRGWTAHTREALGRKALVFRLPSERPLVLWEPDCNQQQAFCGDGMRQYPPYLIAQNLTCAFARDILADAIDRLQFGCDCSKPEDPLGGALVVGHVHDEVIVECNAAQAENAAAVVAQIMEETPVWLDEKFPLKAEAAYADSWYG